MTNEDIAKLPETIVVSGIIKTGSVIVAGKEVKADEAKKHYGKDVKRFDWGNTSKGAGLLALAILMVYLPEETAVMLHQGVKFTYVSQWPQQDFESVIDLREFVSLNFDQQVQGNGSPE